MGRDFLGKWTLAFSENDFIGVGPRGKLVINQTEQRFNAYGTADGLILQAASTPGDGAGKYVAYHNGGYQAFLKRDGEVTLFAVEDAGGRQIRLVDLGIKGQGSEVYYLNVVGQTLGRIGKSGNPPATTLFSRNIITQGLDFIRKRGGNGADLAWVYLKGVQFTAGIAFSNAVFSNANLEEASLPKARFQTAQLDQVNLRKANLTGANLNNASLLKSDLTGARLTQAVMNRIQGREAVLEGADLSRSSLNDADFTGAKLKQALLAGAVINGINFTDTDLREVQMSNPGDPDKRTIYLKNARISSKTNFAGAQMQYMNLTGQKLDHIVMAHTDLTGSAMDNVTLNNADLSYAILTNVSLTGNIHMHGANLSNAFMPGAILTGAQMGSLSVAFRVTAQDEFKQFKTALQQNDIVTVKQIYVNNGIILEGEVVIRPSPYTPERVWEVLTATKTYTVRLETTARSDDTLTVYETVTAANLENAYMMNVDLRSANLYNVCASGVQLFGLKARLDGNAILEKAQFDTANLSGVNLMQAVLNGVNFNNANLVGVQFQGSILGLDDTGGQATLKNANLQGANFADVVISKVMFTDAAVSVANEANPGKADGVWLFSITSSQANTCLAELNDGQHLFNLDISLEEKMAPGKVSPELREAFAENEVNLTEDALISGQEVGFQWQINDGADSYLIRESCDQEKYTPALVVTSNNSTVSFTIPLNLEQDLNNGPVAQSVKKAFWVNGSINLSDAARVAVQTVPVVWQIMDPPFSYILWRGLKDYSLALFARPGIPNLAALFSEHSIALSQRTLVTSSESNSWQLDNDGNNPYNRLTGYIRFNLIKNNDGALDVYAFALRVLGTSADNEEEYKNIICGVTQLSEAKFSDDTVCPNSAFVRTNRTNQLSFRNWMRARVLPKPPFCIPAIDGTYYCPPDSVERSNLLLGSNRFKKGGCGCQSLKDLSDL